MAKRLLLILLLSFLIIPGMTVADDDDHMSGPGQMGNRGNYQHDWDDMMGRGMMGYGMMGGMMQGMMGMGYSPGRLGMMNIENREQLNKILDKTYKLRKELVNVNFEIFEAGRKDNPDKKALRSLLDKSFELQKEIQKSYYGL